MEATAGELDGVNEEAAAVRAALTGSRFVRLRMAVRASQALMRDPNDTRQVLCLGMCLNARHLPEYLLRFALDPDGAALLETRPSIDKQHVDFEGLRRLPAGTLGREYTRFLDDRALDPDVFQAPPGLPPIPAYVIQRTRQTHDLWHVVTGFDTDIPGELALQGFMFAQLRMPLSAWLLTFGTLRFGWRQPRAFGLIRRGFALGQRAGSLATFPWEAWWDRPLVEVRRRLHLPEHHRSAGG